MKKLTSGASGQMFSLCRRSKENTHVHARTPHALTRAQKEPGYIDKKRCIFISLFFPVAGLMMEAELLRAGPAVLADRVSREADGEKPE